MSVVLQLYKKHIRGTEKGAIVQLVNLLLCNLTFAVTKGISCPCNKVYINTRSLKHVYDKRPAEEFDLLINNVLVIVKYPDKVYRNKKGKRGEFCFVKEIKNKKYLCSIEITNKENATQQCEVATFFRVDDNYLTSYELLWEWKGGNLHRSAFVSDIKPA